VMIMSRPFLPMQNAVVVFLCVESKNSMQPRRLVLVVGCAHAESLVRWYHKESNVEKALLGLGYR
jgi:hypothetical protein